MSPTHSALTPLLLIHTLTHTYTQVTYKDLFMHNKVDSGPFLIRIPYRKVVRMQGICKVFGQKIVEDCLGVWPACGVETERWREQFPHGEAAKKEEMKVLMEKKAYALVREVLSEPFKMNFTSMYEEE